MEIGGGGRRQNIGGELGSAGDMLQPLTVLEPILMAALFPLAKVAGFEAVALFAETLDDFWIGKAVEHHEIDLVANLLGQLGDFAVATVRAEGELVVVRPRNNSGCRSCRGR